MYEYVEEDWKTIGIKEVSSFSGKHIYGSGYVADCEDIHFGLMNLANTHE